MYALSGVARFNLDRRSESVHGEKGRKKMVYNSALVDRVNSRYEALFGEVLEPHHKNPIEPGTELIGLEYLFRQSDTDPFGVSDNYQDVRASLENDDDSQDIGDIVDERRDDGYDSDGVDETVPKNPPHMLNVTDLDKAAVHDPPCVSYTMT